MLDGLLHLSWPHMLTLRPTQGLPAELRAREPLAGSTWPQSLVCTRMEHGGGQAGKHTQVLLLRAEIEERNWCWSYKPTTSPRNPPLVQGTHCWSSEPTDDPRCIRMELLGLGCRLHQERKRLKTLAGWRTETLRKWRLSPAPLESLAPG